MAEEKIFPSDINLIPPDMDYRYFEDYDKYKFNYKTKKFNINNAWFLAEASFLAYCHPQFVRLAFHEIGLKNFKAFSGLNVARGFVADNGKFAVVVFRGTEIKSFYLFPGVFADLSVAFTKTSPVKVHSGFQTVLDEIWDGENGMMNYLKKIIQKYPKIKIWFTGHSLGATMATIAASKVDFCSALYTYGSPRVGNKEFFHSIKIPVYRIVNNHDPITMLPPKKINFITSGEEYQHVGKLKFINKHHQLCNFFDEKITIRNTKNITFPAIFKIFKENINIDFRDHAPILYAIYLKALRT